MDQKFIFNISKSFVGSITRSGKKSKSKRIYFFTVASIKKLYGLEGVQFLNIVIESVRPKIFLTSKKVAGVVYKIPAPISRRKSQSMAVKWILQSASRRSKGKDFQVSLVDELNDIFSNSNNLTLKKRDEFHRTAFLNKPFLRYYRF